MKNTSGSMVLRFLYRREVNILDKALYLDILHSKGLTCENLANFMHISNIIII